MSQFVWEKFYETTLTSATTSITISGLTGNTDIEYKLVARIINDYNGAAYYYVRPNNDTGSNYGFQYIQGSNTTKEAGRYTDSKLQFTQASALGNIGFAELSIQSKSGYVRTVITEYPRNISGTTIEDINLTGQVWNNTADEITSLVVYASQTNGLGVGTNITLYRKVATYLQSYFESTIKTQGSYSLKCIAAITNSLNNKLTKTLSPVSNLTGVKNLKFDMRASRTGANVKLGLHDANPRSNADIDDEDMADITDWTDDDSGGGESTQVTFDSKSCMKLDAGVSSGGQSKRYQDIGTFGTRTVFSFSLYCDAIGTTANGDDVQFNAFNGSTLLTLSFASDGLYCHNGAAYVEVGTNLVVQDVWQEWTFDVDWTAQTVDVYLNGVSVASDVDCSFGSAVANGTVQLKSNYNASVSGLVYIDWFKAGSTTTDVGITTELTPTISSADTFQTVNWDLSSVIDANKDAIDQIIITIVNADAANTFYLDYAEIAQAIDVFGIIG